MWKLLIIHLCLIGSTYSEIIKYEQYVGYQNHIGGATIFSAGTRIIFDLEITNAFADIILIPRDQYKFYLNNVESFPIEKYVLAKHVIGRIISEKDYTYLHDDFYVLIVNRNNPPILYIHVKGYINNIGDIRDFKNDFKGSMVITTVLLLTVIYTLTYYLYMTRSNTTNQ